MARGVETVFTTIRSEGGLLPPDLLARITRPGSDLPGLQPADYGLAAGVKLNEEIASAWERAKRYWAAFQSTTELLGESDSGTTETRNELVGPLLRVLGYKDLPYHAAAEQVDGRSYPISHRAGKEPDAPPVHIVSFRQELDRADGSLAGKGKSSPHTLLQEFLNGTDHLWAVVTNGRRLRLLRDNQRFSRAAFVEFDLEGMFAGSVYPDFVPFYLLVHRSRLPQPGTPATECWLERWKDRAEADGARALGDLRKGVTTAITALGQGFLDHPDNVALRQRLESGDLPVGGYYRQLLRLVYRMLFLLAAEDRGLLFEDQADPGAELYRAAYGMDRLRVLAGRKRHLDRHDDLWRSLSVTFHALRDEEAGRLLGLRPLAGGLFGEESAPDLDAALLGNSSLLAAVRALTVIEQDGSLRWINYRDMDVEELGSVYEGLLEFQPRMETAAERPTFSLGGSTERKTTGSYYTNPGLVAELIRSALEPVIAQAVAKGRTPEEKRAALLDLKVVDPACGSGHFLLAAARRIGRELARVEMGESEPDPAVTRHATREAIAHCVYGVDLNPLAVDLCKLALWLEAHEPGRPIGFLDHHIRHGNSLIGATAAVMEQGIPNEAFDPLTGDDKEIARAVKKRNSKEQAGQRPLENAGWSFSVFGDDRTRREFVALMGAPDESVDAVTMKAKAFTLRRNSPDYRRRVIVADLWTAAFFWRLTSGAPQAPTQATWKRLSEDIQLLDGVGVGRVGNASQHGDMQTLVEAGAIARDQGFFHWEIEFEDVFGRDEPGFDCVLGNPPWERVKLQEQEFFAQTDEEISGAPNAAARKRMIAALPESNDPVKRALFDSYRSALRQAEGQSAFLRQSGRYPLTGAGDVNLYSVFAELMATLPAKTGQAGVIVPSGIATDDGNKRFFGWLVGQGRLRTLFDFENRRPMFHGVDSRMKFSLVTTSGAGRLSDGFDAAFFLHDPAELRDPERTFRLTAEEIALLNPNTRTCPIFRSRRDAEITLALYRAAPVLVREADPVRGVDEENPWGVSFKTMFHMSNDSHLFRTREELEKVGLELGADGRFRSGRECWLPLYEAKMIHQYDHRAADVVKNLEITHRQNQPRELTLIDHQSPDRLAEPYSWIDEREVLAKFTLGNEWLYGWRDVTAVTNERTFISTVIPLCGVGNTIFLALSQGVDAREFSALVANLNSFVLDFVARQKVGGLHLNYFVVKSLPALPPEIYTAVLREEITKRVLRLTYTAWDMEPFARDLGYEGPPFRWDETERAVLRAELDGIYAHLYGLNREDFDYILGTFPIVNRKDQARYGEERTRRMCLEAYDYFSEDTLLALLGAVGKLEVALGKHVVDVLGQSMTNVSEALQVKAEAERSKQGKPLRAATLSDFLGAGYINLIGAVMEENEARFSATFDSKSQIGKQMGRLTTLRNALAHRKEVVIDSKVRTSGEGAMRWFAERLGVAVDLVPGVSITPR